MRVLLADRQPMARHALRTLLVRQPGMRVVGEAGDARSLVEQVRTANPELVLLDWRLKDLRSSDLVRVLRSIRSDLRVIALCECPDMRTEVLAAGADAFVSKIDPPGCLLARIYTIGNSDTACRPQRCANSNPIQDETSAGGAENHLSAACGVAFALPSSTQPVFAFALCTRGWCAILGQRAFRPDANAMVRDTALPQGSESGRMVSGERGWQAGQRLL